MGSGEDAADAATLERTEKNVFAYWPALVERLQTQFNADFVDYDALPESLRERYLSAAGEWRVDILPAEDVRDPAALKRFVNAVEAEIPDIAGGALQTQ